MVLGLWRVGGLDPGFEGRSRLEMGPLSLHACLKSLPCEGPEPEGNSRNSSMVTADGARSPPQSLRTGGKQRRVSTQG